MNKEQLRQAVAVMLAAAEGKPIQYKRREETAWCNVNQFGAAFDWGCWEYRVKPEQSVPYRRYLWRDSKGRLRTACAGQDFSPNSGDIEKDPIFIRWIDTDWQVEDV